LGLIDAEPQQSVSQFGSTDAFDFQFHTAFGRVGVDFYLQDFKGFYLADSASLGLEGPDGRAYLRKDLSAYFFGVNLLYVLWPEQLSLLAATSMTARQIESGGSPLLMWSFGEQRVLAEASPLAPEGWENVFGDAGLLQDGRFRTMTLGGGYGQTVLLSDTFFLHGTLIASLGGQSVRLRFVNELPEASLFSPTIKAHLRLGGGWNNDYGFAALQFYGDSTNLVLRDAQLGFASFLVFANIGVRSDFF
jgi:hypothetical protein